MLYLHQIGSVKIGEVVRYKVTYTPAHDRMLPAPEYLYLRIRNVSNSALRAAFVHGPYTLYVDAYPATFDPNAKFENPRHYGVPEFEPMLKAGGSWSCRLTVPESIRHDAGSGGSDSPYGEPPGQSHNHNRSRSLPPPPPPSASWIINVSSQVIFSTSAAVHYEVLLARDAKSLDVGGSFVSGIPNILSSVSGGGSSSSGGGGSSGDRNTGDGTGDGSGGDGTQQALQPGRVSDYQRGRDGHHPDQPRGVFSRAIRMQLEDTAALWNKPRLPGWDGPAGVRMSGTQQDATQPRPKQKKVHLVVLTHGLHSNLGADMLFLKESIDAAVQQAKIDRKARRAREGKADEDDDDDEEVVVRGYSGNATRTERGIKYLGKRLARYVLAMTYPDQPFLPSRTSVEPASPVRRRTNLDGTGPKESSSSALKRQDTLQRSAMEMHRGYRFTKISFIAHSLGGLVQTYAVAYIQKHSPRFFDLIEPVNFIAMASPFLGLNHENPMYVKFALDFGLVGRSGQDLGLTWRPPTLARSGWDALVGNLGDSSQKKAGTAGRAPESKPLLRILPTGPAHTALKKFRRRTVYSNVVNDGIVPLRTSCLLFLDWQGLGRVEKARREAGLVESVVGFGWAELTGANVITPREDRWTESEATEVTEAEGKTHKVPQPPSNATLEDDRQSLRAVAMTATTTTTITATATADSAGWLSSTASTNNNPFSNFLNFFKSGGSEPATSPQPSPRALSPAEHAAHAAHPAAPHSHKQNKIYKRSQTLRPDGCASPSESAESTSGRELDGAVTNGEGVGHATDHELVAPPKTSFFESATDLLNPKVPSIEYLVDPARRPRTIFHDRMYHPTDIPLPPMKPQAPSGSLISRRTLSFQRRTTSMTSVTRSTPASAQQSRSSSPFQDDPAHSRALVAATPPPPPPPPVEVVDSASMKVEEKIARAYHRGLSWRKVLVKLEPDAHNNIVVRRMFANAYGWPVVKHLVDAHFSDAAEACMDDAQMGDEEHALPLSQAPGKHGEETVAQEEQGEPATTAAVVAESAKTEPRSLALRPAMAAIQPSLLSASSEVWSDRDWEATDYSSDEATGQDEAKTKEEAKTKAKPKAKADKAKADKAKETKPEAHLKTE